MGRGLSKNKLLLEVASATGLSRNDVTKILNILAAIAYREAENGFTLPGICRLKVAQKKACRRRNPKTGKILLIGEHRVLRITPLKKAKDAVAPRPADLVTEIDEPTPPPAAAQPEAASQPPPTTSAPVTTPPISYEAPPDTTGEIVFRCAHCNSVLAAPPTQVGTEGACPFCKGKIVVPGRDAKPAIATPPKTEVARDRPPPAKRVEDFITFVCQTCNQEIEAPIEMLGMEVNCPACDTAIHVPTSEEREKIFAAVLRKPVAGIDRSSMTIRIDLSKLEKGRD
jgi:DNA-binding protein HU-beta